VVERASGSDEEPRTQPFASTSGRIIEAFLDLNEGEVRHRGGPVRAPDFRSLDRSETYMELIHLLYVYPLSLHAAKKQNVLVKVEVECRPSGQSCNEGEALVLAHPLGQCIPLRWLWAQSGQRSFSQKERNNSNRHMHGPSMRK
jgi:hypothetical protein